MKTHFTLTAWFNLAVIVVLAIAAGTLLSTLTPPPILLASTGAAAGLVAGALQRSSVASSPAVFASAGSMREVRRAFRSNRPGTLSIVVTWIAAAVLFVIALPRDGATFLNFLAGYASFMLVREIVAFGAISHVRRLWRT